MSRVVHRQWEHYKCAIIRLVDGLPLFYMVGIMTCLIFERQRRLGDMTEGILSAWTGLQGVPRFANDPDGT